MNRRWILVCRWLLLVALVAAAAALAVWSPSLDTDGLQSAAARWGVWAALAFAGVYVAATLLVVPKNVLTVGAGLVFGFGFGSALVWAAALAGAAAAFWVGRFLGLDAVRHLAGPRQDRFAELAARRGGVAVLIARLVPVVPLTVVNYGSGVAGVGFWPYLAATAVGIVPGTLLYAALGAFGSAPTSWPFVVAASVLGAGTVAALVAGVRRRRDRPSRKVPPPSRWPAPEVGG